MNGTRFLRGGLAITCSIFAAFFYANFRVSTWLGQQLTLLQHSDIQLLYIPSIFINSLPSILLTVFLAMCLSLISFHFYRKKLNPAACALLISCSLESLQLTHLLIGTFDWADIISICITSTCLYFLLGSNKQVLKNNHTQTSLAFTLLASSYLLSMGCVEEYSCNDSYSTCVTPVTLSWEELRADITPSYANETALSSPGKIHIKGDHLFIIDKYRGVHIFDQSDPQNPIRLVFIPIIGALDISVQEDLIYVNSFTDLVTVNYQTVLNGSFNQTHISRKQHVFAAPRFSTFFPEGYAINGDYDAYDNFIVGRYSTWENIPKSGFIIGYYNQQGTKILYGEYESDPSLVETSEEAPNATESPQQIGG